MRSNIQKGTFEYMPTQKKKEIILTILYFACSLAFFLLGYIMTKTKANLLTVVAVLGLLPSSKSAVRMIMFIKSPAFSKEVNQKIASCAGTLDAVYGLVLTAYEGTYPLSCIIVREHELCAYSEFSQCKADACEEHIQNMLKQNNFAGMHVKVMKDETKFVNRLTQLEQTAAIGKEKDILQLMCDISL